MGIYCQTVFLFERLCRLLRSFNFSCGLCLDIDRPRTARGRYIEAPYSPVRRFHELSWTALDKRPGPTMAVIWALLCTGIFLTYPPTVSAQPPDAELNRAVICESIQSYQPVNPAVVFSISLGEVFCFSYFDPVRVKTPIFHKWYQQDKLIFSMRLVLTPPKWSSFSRIQLRDADKGPWRVEIQDQDGKILKTLRFSITD